MTRLIGLVTVTNPPARLGLIWFHVIWHFRFWTTEAIIIENQSIMRVSRRDRGVCWTFQLPSFPSNNYLLRSDNNIFQSPLIHSSAYYRAVDPDKAEKYSLWLIPFPVEYLSLEFIKLVNSWGRVHHSFPFLSQWQRSLNQRLGNGPWGTRDMRGHLIPLPPFSPSDMF